MSRPFKKSFSPYINLLEPDWTAKARLFKAFRLAVLLSLEITKRGNIFALSHFENANNKK